MTDNKSVSIDLPLPAKYYPIEKGLYEVAPGLRTFGTPFGNDKRDELVFQLDSEFYRYRENKLKCRQENLSKYYCTHSFKTATSTAVSQFFIDRLLTNEKLVFDENLILKNMTTLDDKRLDFFYASSFDALCSQVQEDVAVMCSSPLLHSPAIFFFVQ